MKYLTIIRHADAPFLSNDQNDFDRNLSEIGFKKSQQIGQKLANYNIDFDLMISSTAIRAINTCHTIAVEIKYSLEQIKLINGLYGVDENGLNQIISKIKKNINSLALVGHNPSIHNLYERIIKSKTSSFPTCSLAHIRLEIDDWKDWMKSNKKVLLVIKP